MGLQASHHARIKTDSFSTQLGYSAEARTVLVILLAAVDKSSTRKGVIRRDAARGDWEGMLRAGQSGSRETGAGQGDQTSGAAPIDALPQASFSIS